MELDDLKGTWDQANDRAGQQRNLTPGMIDLMTQRKFYSKTKRIAYPEISGVIICIISAVVIGLNYNKLDSTFLQGAAIVSIMLLLSLSVISLVSLRQLNISGDVNRTYAETLREFAYRKLRFYKLQKLNIGLSYVLLVSIIVLMSKLFTGRDISDLKYFWIFSFSFGYLFLLFYSVWVFKYYRKTINQAEELLRELEDVSASAK